MTIGDTCPRRVATTVRAVALIVPFAARRPADAAMSVGDGRAEAMTALVTCTMLVVISVWLACEAMRRLVEPPDVAGNIVMALATLAPAIDLARAAALPGRRVSASSRDLRRWRRPVRIPR